MIISTKVLLFTKVPYRSRSPGKLINELSWGYNDKSWQPKERSEKSFSDFSQLFLLNDVDVSEPLFMSRFKF